VIAGDHGISIAGVPPDHQLYHFPRGPRCPKPQQADWAVDGRVALFCEDSRGSCSITIGGRGAEPRPRQRLASRLGGNSI
jgi:hypothetical protein